MRREARAASHEERWISALKKSLVKAGVTADAIAAVIQRALTAKRMGVGDDGEAVSLGPHHNVQLKAAAMATEIHLPRRAGQLDPGRVMLNIQAGAKVQLVFFGTAIEPTPEAETGVPSLPAAEPVPMSDVLKTHLVRQGKLNPDGSVAEAPKRLEVPPGPEGKARERGERWLK